MTSQDPYIRLKQLGQGSFGRVLLVRDSRDQQLYVLKEVDLQQFGAKGKKEALKEVSFLSCLRHPYIITYKEFFEKIPSGPGAGGQLLAPLKKDSHGHASGTDPYDTGNKKMLFIIMEYADGGDLDAKIKNQKKLHHGQLFPEQQILDWFVQIVLAVKHIHDRKILHRDIKAENIFLMSDGNSVKVGDFGISKHLSSTMAQAMTRIGTPYYLSPEICMNKPYNQKSDIWSLGVVLYELCTLRHPFDATSMESLLKKIVKGQHGPISSKAYSSELRNLVDLLLSKDPRKRPSINEICKMDFLKPMIQRFLTPVQLDEEFSHTMIHEFKPLPIEQPSQYIPTARKKKQQPPMPQPLQQLPPPTNFPSPLKPYQQAPHPQHPVGIKPVIKNVKEAPLLPSPFRPLPSGGGPLSEDELSVLKRKNAVAVSHMRQQQQELDHLRELDRLESMRRLEREQQHQRESASVYERLPHPQEQHYESAADERSRRKFREYEQALSIQHQRERELERERQKEKELQRQIAQMKKAAPASFPGHLPPPTTNPYQQQLQHPSHPHRLNPSYLPPAGGAGAAVNETTRRRKGAAPPPNIVGSGPLPSAHQPRQGQGVYGAPNHYLQPQDSTVQGGGEDGYGQYDRRAEEIQRERELAAIRANYRAEKEARRAARLEKHQATRNHILPIGRTDDEDFSSNGGTHSYMPTQLVSPYHTDSVPLPQPRAPPVIYHTGPAVRRSYPPPSYAEAAGGMDEIVDEVDLGGGGGAPLVHARSHESYEEDSYEADFVDEPPLPVPQQHHRSHPRVPQHVSPPPQILSTSQQQQQQQRSFPAVPSSLQAYHGPIHGSSGGGSSGSYGGGSRDAYYQQPLPRPIVREPPSGAYSVPPPSSLYGGASHAHKPIAHKGVASKPKKHHHIGGGGLPAVTAQKGWRN